MSLKQKLTYLFIISCINLNATASPLKSDEYVMFIPDIAYKTESGDININIQAWIYEKERRLGMTTLLTQYLGINKNQLTSKQKNTLYARTQLFRVDSESNKTIKIQFTDNSKFILPTTYRDGRINTTLTLKEKSIINKDNTIHFELYRSGNPAQADKGINFYSPTEGISIISDIDDTIKESDVTNTKQLLINTFINDYQPVSGMSEWYNKLARNNQTVAFHYLSSSPIQLYPALKEFMNKAQFPKGSIHLRESTTWSQVIANNIESKEHKTTIINKLLNAYPKRSFILIGDSGEADPEIYADFMHKHPQQIVCIAIRNTTNENAKSKRYQNTFRDLSPERWVIFTAPHLINNKACLTTD